MHVHVLFDAKGKVLALFHPAGETDAPRLEFHPARGQRVGLLQVPADLVSLEPRQLHLAVSVKLHKDGPRLVTSKRWSRRSKS
jgi:hypothetical protein